MSFENHSLEVIAPTEISSAPEESDLVRGLRQVRATVANGWCRGYLAMSDSGAEVSPLDPSATRFCLIGAMLVNDVRTAEVSRAIESRTGLMLGLWNDAHDKHHVLQMLDGLIADVRGFCKVVA